MGEKVSQSPTPLRDGDSAAWEAYVTKNQQNLARIGARNLGHVGWYGPEDVAQDALLKLWEARTRIIDTGNVDGLAAITARNVAVDVVRKENNHRAYSIEEMSENSVSDTTHDGTATNDALPFLACPKPGPEEQALQSDTNKRVRDAIQTSLLPQEQEAIRHLLQELTRVEIATKVSAPLGTVKSRILRGYHKLHTALADLNPNEEKAVTSKELSMK